MVRSIIFGLLFFYGSVSGLTAQGTVDLWFYDTCKDTIARYPFRLEPTSYDFSASKWKALSSDENHQIKNVRSGSYIAFIWLNRGIEEEGFSVYLNFDVGPGGLTDTLEIPKIIRRPDRASSSTLFMNCDRLCDGEESYVNQSGMEKIRGTFENGIGKEVSFFDDSGLLSGKLFYKAGDAHFYRMEEYIDGELEAYWLYDRINNRNLIARQYNKDGTLFTEYKTYGRKKGY